MKQECRKPEFCDCGAWLDQKPGKGRPLKRCPRCQQRHHAATELKRYHSKKGVQTRDNENETNNGVRSVGS